MKDVKVSETYKLSINNKPFEWGKQFISGSEIRTLASIPESEDVYLKVTGPGDDELISDDQQMDLSQPGREHFYSKTGKSLVTIYIGDNPYEISRGKHTVTEIKNLGKVPLAYELEEFINKVLTPLDDGATVIIKGGEKFYGHPRDGKSS